MLRVLISGAIAPHFIRILALRAWPRSPLPTGATLYAILPLMFCCPAFQAGQQLNGDEFYWGVGKKKTIFEGIQFKKK